MHNVSDGKLVEVIGQDSGTNASGNLFECADVSFNLSNMLFGRRGVHNDIFHHLIYNLVKLHFH